MRGRRGFPRTRRGATRLGVLLCELLTGCTPVDAETLCHAGTANNIPSVATLGLSASKPSSRVARSFPSPTG